MTTPETLIATLAGKRTLVLGGAGFIGSHVVDGLIAAGAGRIVVVDDLSLGRRVNLDTALEHDGVTFEVIDVCDQEALAGVVDREGPFDLCFNLAVMPLPHSLVHPRENVDRNVAMTCSACEIGLAGGFTRLVQFSSSEVYGTAMRAPIAEDHPLGAHTPYAAAKAATDLIALSYGQTFGLEVVIVRPFNTYGERQNDGTYAGLIPVVVRRVQAGQPVIVHGDGEQTRDITYVSDTVRGTLAIAGDHSLRDRAINLGHGSEVSVNAMVASILEAMGQTDHPVVHGAPRLGDVRRLLAGIETAREAIGYEPLVSVDEGLARTVRWYLNSSPGR